MEGERERGSESEREGRELDLCSLASELRETGSVCVSVRECEGARERERERERERDRERQRETERDRERDSR